MVTESRTAVAASLSSSAFAWGLGGGGGMRGGFRGGAVRMGTAFRGGGMRMGSTFRGGGAVRMGGGVQFARSYVMPAVRNYGGGWGGGFHSGWNRGAWGGIGVGIGYNDYNTYPYYNDYGYVPPAPANYYPPPPVYTPPQYYAPPVVQQNLTPVPPAQPQQSGIATHGCREASDNYWYCDQNYQRFATCADVGGDRFTCPYEDITWRTPPPTR